MSYSNQQIGSGSIFGDDFYPTPEKLADRMLSAIEINRNENEILEPSAGKGDLADQIKKRFGRSVYRYRTMNIDTVEINSELQHILRGKEYRVVHNDFLTFNTLKCYDYIVMNPPFSKGAEHLTKALSLLKEGGTCVCLLNSETLNNLCTNTRKALSRQLEELDAKIEDIEAAFIGAERSTKVNVSIVTVKKPEKKEKVSILLDSLKKEEEQICVSPEQRNIVDSDPIAASVAHCRFETKVGLELLQEYELLKPYFDKSFSDQEYDKPIIEIKITPNEYIQEVRLKYWKALFENPIFIRQLTNNLQHEMHDNINKMRDYDFTLENINALQHEMSSKVVAGVEEAIINLFDELSREYSYYNETSKNIHYFNGWKTNKCWKINKKVILPLRWNDNNKWSNSDYVSVDYDAQRKLDTLEKAIAFLDKNRVCGETSIYSACEAMRRNKQTRGIEFRYFTADFYKKGTVHLVFKNEELLHRLNIFGCQKKKWLPPSYGKKQYKDFNQEEKAVVDAFEGEKSYCNTLERELISNVNMNLLTAS
jgi:tRNA1(Val) A37 N6-methylase TrmN6